MTIRLLKRAAHHQVLRLIIRYVSIEDNTRQTASHDFENDKCDSCKNTIVSLIPPSHPVQKTHCVTDRVENILFSSTSHPEKSTRAQFYPITVHLKHDQCHVYENANGCFVFSGNHQLQISIFLFYGLHSLLKESVKLFCDCVSPARDFLSLRLINIQLWHNLQFA